MASMESGSGGDSQTMVSSSIWSTSQGCPMEGSSLRVRLRSVAHLGHVIVFWIGCHSTSFNSFKQAFSVIIFMIVIIYRDFKCVSKVLYSLTSNIYPGVCGIKVLPRDGDVGATHGTTLLGTDALNRCNWKQDLHVIVGNGIGPG